MYDFKNTEEKVRKFWDDHQIFEKSLELRRKGKRFVFWEGPPTANGLPHTGHFLTRIYKDLYSRYKTMRGFFVLRKAGWDTHGLPVEIEIEKELGFTNKKQIEEYGIAKFNRKARQSVWKYTHQWEDMTRRMGFWLDLQHPYVTYHTPYIESVWNILKTISDKGLLYQAHKVVPLCVRCGTPLSAHEVAQGYKKVIDQSVYIKFKLVSEPHTYILAWTTTPWTLPGNVALAVGPEIIYVRVKKDNETYILARDLAPLVLGEGYKVEKELTGSELVGLEYEPLFDVPELRSEKSYRVYPADFVTTGDGTGVVHTAVMYGEDDYVLGTKLELPKFHTVNERGFFIDSLSDGLAGKPIVDHGKKNKDTENYIIEKLKEKGLLLKVQEYEHDYPFCWRCNTPLLYYAKTSWFIRTSALNKELLANNETVNWIPSHVKEGRFGQWLREAKDWNLSRERYWGTPLPIWMCSQGEHKITIGSVKELEKLSVGSKNTYYVMRHGGTTRHEMHDGIINTDLASDSYHLTAEGQEMIEKSLQLLQLDGVDMIYASPFSRTQETAAIAGRVLHTDVKTDDRLKEINLGVAVEGKHVSEAPSTKRSRGFEDKSPDGESFNDVRTRLMDFMREMETTHKNKKILIVSHGDPIWLLNAMAQGLETEEIQRRQGLAEEWYPKIAEIKKLEWRKIPRNEYGELDLHRPFIDEVVLKCPECKSNMRKIPDLIDVWFDSGSMPYAQWHYPFENKQTFKQQFPADFIVEGMDQTRGWFFTLLAISTLLGNGAPYKNVMALGFTLDEKGVKESKSKGNYKPVPEMMDLYGVDILRWYFASTMTAGENKAVIGREIQDKLKGFFFTIQNCIRFFELYATPGEITVQKLSQLDKWILSRFHRMLEDVTQNLDVYDATAAARMIDQFVAEDLSNWWLRRSRKRKEALPLLRLVLLELAKIISPYTPFLAEDMWQRLGGDTESVHLSDWPKVQKKYINDKLETEMSNVRDLIAAGLADRKNKQLKVRQPLASVTLKSAKLNKELEALVQDELNVKKVKYLPAGRQATAQEASVLFDLELTPELRREGYAREAMRQIQDMRKEAKYRMEEEAIVHWHSFDEEVVATMEEWADEIKKDTVLKSLERHRKDGITHDLEKESDLAPGKKIWLGIKK